MKTVQKIFLTICAISAIIFCLSGCTSVLPENLTNYYYKTSRPSAEVTVAPAMIENEKMSSYVGKFVSSKKDENFEYSVYSNGIQINKIVESNQATSLEIPSAIDDTPVIGIATEAFCDNANITNVFVPVTVKYIGDAAFRRCVNLNSVVLTNGLEHVGSKAFDGCTSLENIVFPESVTFIGEYVCALSGVKNISIPSLITEVPAGMYYGSAVENFSLPGHVTLIKESAFEKCDGLVEVTVPGNVQKIERTVFANNVNLKHVVIEEGCKETGYAVFEGDIALETVKFPESLTQLLPSLFPDCNKDIVLYVKEGSRMEEFAINYKYEHVAE